MRKDQVKLPAQLLLWFLFVLVYEGDTRLDPSMTLHAPCDGTPINNLCVHGVASLAGDCSRCSFSRF